MKLVWMASVCLLACSGSDGREELFGDSMGGSAATEGDAGSRDVMAVVDDVPDAETPEHQDAGDAADAMGTGGATARVCQTGDTRTCLGPGACVGAQSCLSDGSGYGDCDCGSAGAGGSGGGATGGTGGAAWVCIPGTEIVSTLQCSYGEVVCSRVCLPDGSGYPGCC